MAGLVVRPFFARYLAINNTVCYTLVMKTEISIDNKLFNDAETFSKAAGLSRSKLYCIAISEYIQNHSPDNFKEKSNNYDNKHDSRIDDDLKAAANRLFAGEDR